MKGERELFTNTISENELGKGEVKLEEENQAQVERETIIQPFQESFTDSVRMTPENQRKFEFDKSANLKLGGLFMNKIGELTLDRARRFLMENPGDFNLPESMAQRLTDEQIKNLVGENPELRKKIAVDPKLAEIIRLHEIFKKAKGNPDTSAKILLFKTVDKLTSEPGLMREIQSKLLESMEGIDIDKEAAEALGGKDKYVQDKIEAYKRENIERIMIGDKDRGDVKKKIDEEIERRVGEEIDRREREGGDKLTEEECEKIRAEEEGKRSALEADEIKKAIKDKKSRVEKALGRSVTDEEVIFLDKKGIDIANVSSSGWSFFRGISLDGAIRGQSEFNRFLEGELAGVKDYFSDMTKGLEGEWREKIEKSKDEILEKSLNEIPADLVRKIYKEKKSLIMAERFRENQLGEDTVMRKRLQRKLGRDGVHIENLVKKFGSRGDLTVEDFDEGINGFTNEEFRKYVKKEDRKPSNDEYSHWLLLLELIFGFIRTENEQK